MFKWIVFFSLIVCSLAAQQCTQDWECASVSENFNYVQCVSGECRCKTELGFFGSATAQDKCSCASPANVYWGKGTPYCKVCTAPSYIVYNDGMPYCVNPAECEQASTEEARQARRRQVVREIYQNLVTPTPGLILAGIKPIDNLFDASVKGRISPVGVFGDFLLVEEYFYALAATPGSYVYDVNIKSLVSSGDKVSVEVDIMFNGTRLYNLTQMGFYLFNSNDRVISLDLVILNLGAATNVAPAARPILIQQLCTALADPTYGSCRDPANDPEGHYSSVEDCINFMNSIEYGTWDNAAQNSVVCRQLHSLLTFTRPATHCPHTGKTGGGKCIPHAYSEYYDVDY